MSVMKIIKHPDKLLREPCKPVTVFDNTLRNEVTNMIETMRDAQGIGLAGSQVGLMKRVLVLDVENTGDKEEEGQQLLPAEVYINPVIVSKSGTIDYEEGCLSIPGVYGSVRRSAELTIQYQDAHGEEYEMETDGLRAIALQHEIDHLNGVLFIDHLSAEDRAALLTKYQQLQKK